MEKKGVRFFGFLLIIIGGFLLLSNFFGFTGFVVLEGSGSYISLIGIVFILAGVLVLQSSRGSGQDLSSFVNDDLSEEDKFILGHLSPEDQRKYVSREIELKRDEDILGGEAPFYVPPLEKGEVVYVHLTTDNKKAKRILEKGLKHGGKNTYGQAFIFTGKDAYVKARGFVDNLSSREKYVGVDHPTNAILFRTEVIPVLNQFSGAIPRNYRGRWKAMFRYDIPRELMRDVENVRISAA